MNPDSWETSLSLLVVILFFGSFIGFWYYHQKRREIVFKKIAGKIDVKFTKRGTKVILDELKKLRLFCLGGNTGHDVSNLLQGDHDDILVSIFDYKYSDGVFVYQQSAIHFSTQTVLFPKFTLLPRDLAEKLEKKSDNGDAPQTLSYPWLPDAYRIHGPLGCPIQTLMNKPFLSYLDDHEGLCVEGNGKQLIVYRYCHLVPPKRLSQFMEQGLHILGLIAGKSQRPC